ncbi:DUF3482 domain-containing protein [Pseudogemmobacter faecipullorum]|uniref:17 kDa surface antigen n=1 Tax=Pseudogemmobacter faecipullorum TaxID=2755041 RepID=A0ABS8CKF9_9RHOB|nr:DUF3482 domain-containing protein [Pseudogemmobacter faecipullorum]MCB5409883.1 hypothetical protein [Pseudogemmobacter faecipullorum]
MRKSLLLLPILALSLAGCVGGNGYNNGYGNGGQPLNSAAVRTIGGAATGALVAGATGGSKTQGALIGAVAGGGSCLATNNCY